MFEQLNKQTCLT